jgi:hypothetical protein
MKIQIEKSHLKTRLDIMHSRLYQELSDVRKTRIDAPFNKGMLFLDSEISRELRKVDDLLHLLWLDELSHYNMFDQFITLESDDLWMIMEYRNRVFPAPKVVVDEETP